MALCPICQNELQRFQRKDNPDIYFWACSHNGQDCNFYCDDVDGAPFLAKCNECGSVLKRKISSKTGQPYVACFNKEEHKEGVVLFFNIDGSPREQTPEPQGNFVCPECHTSLLYCRIRKGRSSGKMMFVCKNAQGHNSGRSHFFEDNGGKPIFPI